MSSASIEKRRIFIGLFEIAGYYANLRHGLEELGCKARIVTLAGHPFGYQEPSCGWVGWLIKWHFRRALQSGGHVWPDWMPDWLRRFIGFSCVWLAALRYDVFLFSYGLSFADDKNGPGLEPLRRLGRKVVFIFNGSDSRATYCDRTGYFIEGKHISAEKLLRLTREKQKKIEWVNKSADLVIDYPLSGHFHSMSYVNFIRLGIPTVVPKPEELPPPPGLGVPGRPVRILHCPSETGIKGSAEVRRVIDKLRKGGFQIDFLELRGVPNARVIEEVRRCDIVVDQLFCDTPMAGLAREAAQFARPVVVGGYAWEQIKPHLPAEEFPPSVLCHPDGLEPCLRSLLEQGPSQWAAIGMRGYEFIRSRWTARQCAERFLHALDVPGKSDLWVDPASCRYVWGCGMHALEVVELAQIIMRTAGRAGFCLDDKPELLALTESLGTLPLMQMSPSEIPALPPMSDETWAVVSSVIERNAALSARQFEIEEQAACETRRAAELADEKMQDLQKIQDLQIELAQFKDILNSAGVSSGHSVQQSLQEMQKKIANFRAMLDRRNRRIEKLEKKLGIAKPKDGDKPDEIDE